MVSRVCLEKCLLDVEGALVRLLDAFIAGDIALLFNGTGDSTVGERIELAISSHIQKVSHIDKLLRRVQQRYEDIRDRPDRTIAYIRSPDIHKASTGMVRYMFSPIRQLPPNVLSIILDLIVIIPSRLGQRAKRYTADLISLTHVCRDWRLAMLKHRNFWNVISLNWPVVQQDGWLERSGGAKIHLIVSCTRKAEISERVLERSSCWQSVTADSVEDKDMPLFHSSFSNSERDLSSLEYCYLSGGPTNLYPIPFTVCPPQLHTLHMMNWKHVDAGLHLYKLEVLRLGNCAFTIQAWVEVLNKCRNLESLVIVRSSFCDKTFKAYLRERSRKNPPIHNVVMGKLKTLAVVAHTDAHRVFLGFVFTSLHTPILQGLHLDCSRFTEIDTGRLFVDVGDFFRKCSFLRHLSFQGHPDLPESVFKTLACNPEKLLGLRHLESLSLGKFLNTVSSADEYSRAIEGFITMLENNPFSSSKPVGKLYIPDCPSDRREWFQARATKLCVAPIVKQTIFDIEEVQ